MRLLQRAPLDRYGLLFVLLVTLLLLFGSLGSSLGRLTVFVMQVAVLLFALATSAVGVRVLRFALLGVALAVILGVAAAFTEVDFPTLFGVLWSLMLIPVIAAVLRRLATHDVVKTSTVFGAICVYLVIGLLAAYVYVVIDGIAQTPFFVSGPSTGIFDYLYFSFVTLTTLGYGDFTSSLDIGRAVAMTESVIGQIFLVTAVARLVSLWRGPRQSAAEADSPDA